MSSSAGAERHIEGLFLTSLEIIRILAQRVWLIYNLLRMTFLNFKNPFSKNPRAPQDYLSLTIAPNKVVAIIWNFQGENIGTLSTAEKEFQNADSLIHEAAVAIDNAAEIAKTDVSKVVFGLSQFWFEEEKLKPEASKILKGLTSDLELEAQAFVTLAIAINHMLKVQDAVTPQAILVGHFGNFCEVHLIKNNKVAKTKTIEGEITSHKVINLIEDMKDEHESLPSKIIVFGDSRDSLTSKLSQANWQEIFVHEPKIESIDDETLGRAVAFAQAADILGHDPNIHAQKSGSAKNELPADNFGFVEGEDILLSHETGGAAQKVQSSRVEKTAVSPTIQDDRDLAVTLHTSDNLEMPMQDSGGGEARNKRRLPKIALGSLIPKNLSPKKLLIGIAALVLLFIVGTFVAGQTLTSANVQVIVNSKSQDFDFTAKVIAEGSNNFDRGEIAGQPVTGAASGSQKAVATGSQKSGTVAKGQIKILNWDKQGEKTFGAGTEVITKDGLKFKIDGDVNVASRSATTPGEAKIGATAADIGPNYNISAGIDLTIVGFDEVFYSGVADTSFTGGDEKQITVASANDLAKLEKALTDSLTEKAKNDLQSKTDGLKIYDESKIVKITKKDFDKKTDEEASLINLDMSIEFQAIAFDENDLKKYLADLTNKGQNSNIEALPETIELLDIKITRNKDVLTLSGRYEAGLVSKLNIDELKGKVAGKGVKQARETIRQSGDVADVQVTFSPALPFVDSIPRDKNKINIKITTN